MTLKYKVGLFPALEKKEISTTAKFVSLSVQLNNDERFCT